MQRRFGHRSAVVGVALAVVVGMFAVVSTAGAAPLNITVVKTSLPGYFSSVICAPGGTYCLLSGANATESTFKTVPIVNGRLGAALTGEPGSVQACPTATTCLGLSTGLVVVTNGRPSADQTIKTASGARVELDNIACASASTCYGVGVALTGGLTTQRIAVELVPIRDGKAGRPVQIGETGGHASDGASVGWGTINPLIGCWDADHCLVTGSYETTGSQLPPASSPTTYHNFSIVITGGHAARAKMAPATESRAYLAPVCAPSSSTCLVADSGYNALSVFHAGAAGPVLNTGPDHLDTPADTLNTVACEDSTTCFMVGKGKIVPIVNGVLQAPQLLPRVAGQKGTLQIDGISCPDSDGCYAAAVDPSTGAGYLITVGTPTPAG